MVFAYIDALLSYALERGLIESSDVTFCRNGLLEVMGLEGFEQEPAVDATLEQILNVLADDAAARRVITDSGASRDLFTTKLMGVLTPRPSEVQRIFNEKYALSPKQATDWFYALCKNSDYIRSYRVERDLRWTTQTEFGELDITINLSKPEKDPKDIAAAKARPMLGYPRCLLCAENEGYAGHISHPARQNLRIMPVKIAGGDWGWQYSPYVYYNEHCIVLNREHMPMIIDRAVFPKLMAFVKQYPHYFVGSNADLPIVGGSILSHEHFQGGCYEFAMAKAPVERKIVFEGFEELEAGIVKWPMSVLRVSGSDEEKLTELCDRILTAWRSYSDESVSIYAFTDGVPHNTITPIARMRGGRFELDLVLRNNLTTPSCPMGLFHPHEDKHNIKKENIGLIEVMGLAVLPGRLKAEMEALKKTVLAGGDLRQNEQTAKHANWFDTWRGSYEPLTEEKLDAAIKNEIGRTFSAVLEDAGVFKRSEQGREAFWLFVQSIGGR